jgi:methionine-rich copper-binding protein CopC
MKTVLFVAGLAAAVAAGGAEAHPRLTSLWPSSNAVVSSPDLIRLNFSERLIPKLSHIDLVTGNGKVVKTTAIAAASNGKQLSVKPATHLTAGVYTINWTAVSVDTHRVQGKSQFSVK